MAESLDNLDFSAFSKLKEGLSIGELLEKGEKEFVIEADEPDLRIDSEMEQRVDLSYDFEDYAPHINLDCIQCGPDDVTSSETPFERIRKLMENVTDDGKVMKQIIQSGTYQIPENAIVYLHYNSYFEMEEVPFDSSGLRQKEPLRLQMGDGRHYEGFEMAVMSMRVGEKSRFLIHHDLAFRDLGVPPRIPPCATVLLVIEIFKAVECVLMKEEEESLSVHDRKNFEHVYKVAKGLHAKGNDYFSHKNIAGAVDNYLKAENLLVKCSLSSQVEEDKFKHILLKIYTNLTVCYNNIKMKIPERVCIFARKAFEIDPKQTSKNAKLLHNLGLAHFALCNYKKSLQNFKKAQKVEPNNPEINQAIEMVEKKMKMDEEIEKDLCTRALGFSSLKMENSTPKTTIDDEYKEKATQILDDFAQGSLSSLQLSSGFTYDEKIWLKSECHRLGLVFEESNAFSNPKEIIIKKKL